MTKRILCGILLAASTLMLGGAQQYQIGQRSFAVPSAPPSYGCPTPTITDSFPPPSLSGNWTTNTGVWPGIFVTSGGQAQAVSNNGDHVALYSGTAVGSTQCASAVYHYNASSIFDGAGPVVNAQNYYGYYTGYAAICLNGVLNISKIQFGAVGTTSTCADGDTILISNDASGHLVVKDNGATVITVTDTTFSGGGAGIYIGVPSFAPASPVPGLSSFAAGY